MNFRDFSESFTRKQLLFGLVGSILLTVASQGVVYYKLWQFFVCTFNTPPGSNVCTMDFYKDLYLTPGGWLLMVFQVFAIASLVFFLDGYSKYKKRGN